VDPTAIDVEKVTAVLLIDGWHYIQPGSFQVNPYAFMAGEVTASKPQPGYFFSKVDQISREHQYFLGPIDCVMGVRYGVETEVTGQGDADGDDLYDDDEDF